MQKTAYIRRDVPQKKNIAIGDKFFYMKKNKEVV